MFIARAPIVRYCQSWKDLTTAEITQYGAVKNRATCHMKKEHTGDHQDTVLGLAWSRGGWPNTVLYQPTKDA